MIHILPVYSGQFISLVKITSVSGYISVMDLTRASDIIRSRTYEAFFPLVFTAVIYFLLSALLLALLRGLEKRICPESRRTDKIEELLRAWKSEDRELREREPAVHVSASEASRERDPARDSGASVSAADTSQERDLLYTILTGLAERKPKTLRMSFSASHTSRKSRGYDSGTEHQL